MHASSAACMLPPLLSLAAAACTLPLLLAAGCCGTRLLLAPTHSPSQPLPPPSLQAGSQEYWMPNGPLLAIEFLVMGFLELKRLQVPHGGGTARPGAGVWHALQATHSRSTAATCAPRAAVVHAC